MSSEGLRSTRDYAVAKTTEISALVLSHACGSLNSHEELKGNKLLRYQINKTQPVTYLHDIEILVFSTHFKKKINMQIIPMRAKKTMTIKVN